MALLHLPAAYDAVVGEEFALYYRGLLNCIEPSYFDLEFTFADGRSRGAAYRRKYIYTPAEGEEGEYPLTLTVRDVYGNVAEVGKTLLRVHAAPKSPKAERTLLCVGDSLTFWGMWPNVLAARLAAAGVDGIRTLGSCLRPEEGEARFEGYGGWSLRSSTTDFRSPCFMYIDGDFSDKDEATDQHSQWRDESGAVWKLESVTPTRAKLIFAYAGGKAALPPRGVLTHVLGGEHHGDMVYENGRTADANPFYDTERSTLDFRAYAARMGAERIDHVLALLGANSTDDDEATYKADVRAFLDPLLEQFPDCRVVLAGCAVPDRDGLAHNYGTAWHAAEKCTFIRRLCRWYTELAAEPAYAGRVRAIDLAGQFDTDYLFPSAERRVNPFSEVTERVGTNALHPTREGQGQIASIFYAAFTAELL